MRKASEVLTLIGFIFAILGAVGCLIGMIVCFVMASPEVKEHTIQMINEGTITVNGYNGSAEEIATALQVAYTGAAIACLIETLVCVAAAILVMLARTKKLLGLYVASIVLGALGGGICIILGSIFGIVANNQENNAQPVQE